MFKCLRLTSRRIGTEAGAHRGEVNERRFQIVVVGGGNSAGYFCKAIREWKFNGSVAVFSSEAVLPYERPALTKAFLHPPGAKVRARLPGFHTCVGAGGDRQTEEWYKENGISMFLSTRVTALNVQEKSLTATSSNGEQHLVYFDKLVLATGARPLTPDDLKIKNGNLGRVYTIREEKEALKMVQELEGHKDIKNVVIVGGGYIGMEVAAALSGWGFKVTVVSNAATLLPRLFPEEISQIFQTQFEKRGINFLMNRQAIELAPSEAFPNRVGKIILRDDTILDADAVVFGVGSRLNLDLVAQENIVEFGDAGVGGIRIDYDCQTTNNSIYAIGDIAALKGKVRYEHVDFCRKSADRAAGAIATGTSLGFFDYLPFYYSRCFEYTDNPVIFQFYGTSDGHSVKLFGAIDEAMETPADMTLPMFGAAWVNEKTNKIKGILLCSATADQYTKAKEMVMKDIDYEVNFHKSFL